MLWHSVLYFSRSVFYNFFGTGTSGHYYGSHYQRRWLSEVIRGNTINNCSNIKKSNEGFMRYLGISKTSWNTTFPSQCCNVSNKEEFWTRYQLWNFYDGFNDDHSDELPWACLINDKGLLYFQAKLKTRALDVPFSLGGLLLFWK